MLKFMIFLKPFLAVILLVVIIIAYILSRNDADDYQEEINKYDFKLTFLAGLGFMVFRRLPQRLKAIHDRKIIIKIGDLYGQRKAYRFLEVHNVQKIVLCMTLLSFFTLINLLGDGEFTFQLFGLIVTGLIYYLVDKEIDKKLETRKREILVDLPEVINTLTLVVNAGLPFTSAMQKVISDSDAKRPLFAELNILMAEIQAGKPMGQAYEDLAQRCKVPEITRFVTAVLQNLNRGNADLVSVLRMLAQEAWERRKDIAKKRGEEASSKLVFPMVLVFIAVSIIVMAPAVMSMGV